MKLGFKKLATSDTRGRATTSGRKKRGLAASAAVVSLVAFSSIGAVAPGAIAAEPAVYTLNLNGQVVTLTEGQTAVYGMQRIAPAAAPGHISPNVVYYGDAGTLTVTASGGVYHYSIAMSIPATTFVGFFGVTDLTSGLSGGLTPEGAFTGSAPTSRLYGHRYSGNLSGEAFFLGAPVASTMPNNTLYTYP